MAHYADSITSISHATTQTLRDFYAKESLPQPYLATNPLPSFGQRGEVSHREQARPGHRFAGKPIVLSVSTIEVRKNHLLLAKIWTECIREGIDMPILVLVGQLGWDVNELFQWVAHAPELDGRVLMVSDVEDEELVELYCDALFTVFPSRIEGWGLPITESLSYGTPCVHSTDPAQREASQGLMPALHPDDFFGWKAEILRLLSDTSYRDQLRTEIAANYVRRTPQEYCTDFEAVLRLRREQGT
jgi:glycosyltransferase involved in cell wall biosynthesis